MTTFIQLLPILAVVALLASGRVKLLQAGLIGLLLTLPGVWLASGDPAQVPWIAVRGCLRGAWIAWQAISIILGGLFLYQVLRVARPELFAPRAGARAEPDPRALFSICFLLGPFVEAATGFGVGYLITVSALMRIGVGALHAAVFGIFSQMMVPWGALGIGTYIGAELAGMPVQVLGSHGALISTALFLGYLLVFWWMQARTGRVLSGPRLLDDLIWMLALCALLYAANRLLAVEVAGLVSTGSLLVLRYFRDRDPRAGGIASTVQTALPYALLTLLLVLTRIVPGVRETLSTLLVLRPAGDLPGFPILYHASFWLVVVSTLYGLRFLDRGQWRQVGAEVWHGARVPVLVSLVFLMMAEVMSQVGTPAALAQSWVAATDRLAVAASPVFGMLAGALTGSNTASNGMMMTIQIELASRAGAAPAWIAALQNVAGSNAILISPVRIAMGCALVGLPGREAEVYRLLWPLGLVLFLVLEVVAFLALR